MKIIKVNTTKEEFALQINEKGDYIPESFVKDLLNIVFITVCVSLAMNFGKSVQAAQVAQLSYFSGHGIYDLRTSQYMNCPAPYLDMDGQIKWYCNQSSSPNFNSTIPTSAIMRP